MSHKRRPSLLGALIWIGIGVLFLMQNFGFGMNFWSLARRYWPVLLILLGLGKILEYFLKKDAISIRAGEIFGILFLIFFGFVISRIPFGPVGPFIAPFPDISWGPSVPPGRWIGDSYTYTEDASYPFENAKPIRIENSNGSVSISPGSDGEIRVRLKKVVYASTSRAKDIADEIHLEGESERGAQPSSAPGADSGAGNNYGGEYFVIRTNRDSLTSMDARFNTDMEILVPKNSQIQVRNAIGEVTVSEIDGDLDLSTTHRNLEVRDCSGSFTISNRFADTRLSSLVGNVSVSSRGRVYVEDIKGDVSVNNEYSPSEILGVDGRVTVSSTEGSIRMERITKPVVIEGRGTQIRVADLKDSLKVNATHRSVDISDVASDVVLESSYCTLSLKNIEGNIEIESNSDRVNADDIRGRLNLKARASSLRLNGIEGTLDVRTTLKDVIVNGLEGSCSIINEYADVSLSAASLQAGDIYVKNRNGGIDLFLPDDASFAIDAVARNGRIDSSYGGLPSPRNENNTGVLKSRVKAGGPTITLETEYSNIHISQTGARERSSEVVSRSVVTAGALRRSLVLDRIFSMIRQSGMRVLVRPAEAGTGGMR